MKKITQQVDHRKMSLIHFARTLEDRIKQGDVDIKNVSPTDYRLMQTGLKLYRDKA